MNLLSTDKLNISINETLHIKNNNVIYTNTKTNNSLVVLSNKNEYDIYCHMKYRKLIIYCNYSDPPDYLYFIPIDEIIVNPLLDYSDHRLDYQGQYYIDAETTWSNEIDLADDYSYAVVGHPNRKYLWILSRTSSMNDAIYQQIIARVKQKVTILLYCESR